MNERRETSGVVSPHMRRGECLALEVWRRVLCSIPPGTPSHALLVEKWIKFFFFPGTFGQTEFACWLGFNFRGSKFRNQCAGGGHQANPNARYLTVEKAKMSKNRVIKFGERRGANRTPMKGTKRV